MALTFPLVETTGADRAQLPYGLLSVLAPLPGTGRWAAGGATWQALTCAPAVALPMDCDPGEEFDLVNSENTGPSFGMARPFSVHGYFECGLATNTVEGANALAEAHLRANEQTAVEKTFWEGDQGNFPNLATGGDPNEELGEGEESADPYDAPVNLGTFGPVEIIAELEDFIAANYGSVGVIHMPRAIATRLIALEVLHTRQGRLYTALDTPVVAGAGYSGDTIRATPALFAFRTDVETHAGGDSGITFGTNDILGTADRTYLIGFDPCGIAYATISFEETQV